MSPNGTVRIFRTVPFMFNDATLPTDKVAMDIKTIGVEEWLNVWEKSATWDIAQSTISSQTR